MRDDCDAHSCHQVYFLQRTYLGICQGNIAFLEFICEDVCDPCKGWICTRLFLLTWSRWTCLKVLLLRILLNHCQYRNMGKYILACLLAQGTLSSPDLALERSLESWILQYVDIFCCKNEYWELVSPSYCGAAHVGGPRVLNPSSRRLPSRKRMLTCWSYMHPFQSLQLWPKLLDIFLLVCPHTESSV